MAKTKAELLEEAKALNLEVTEKNTVAEITDAIKQAKASEAEEAPVEADEASSDDEQKVTKAGKRSAKAIREAEEQAEKEARKAAGDTTPQDEDAEAAAKKGPTPISRPRAERRGKNYKKAAEQLESGKVYSLAEALELATKTSPVKFDASVEAHVVLGVDPRQADQNIRATVSLPHGTGKTVRVAVYAPDTEHEKAKKAGADIVGEDELLKKLDKEELDFDVLIATPQLMPKLSKYARLLGPRGLMPNPKSGTVATDVAKAVQEAKAGRVEYRVDKQAVVHLAIGKVSFGADKLKVNADTFFASLQSNRPSGLKGTYIKSATIASTMGPGIKVDHNQL